MTWYTPWWAERTRDDDMLNIFRGGPYHNTLVETADLCKKIEYAWVDKYRWTPERIVGSLTGREARVWVYKED